jgi:hypothetical protein
MAISYQTRFQEIETIYRELNYVLSRSAASPIDLDLLKRLDLFLHKFLFEPDARFTLSQAEKVQDRTLIFDWKNQVLEEMLEFDFVKLFQIYKYAQMNELQFSYLSYPFLSFLSVLLKGHILSSESEEQGLIEDLQKRIHARALTDNDVWNFNFLLNYFHQSFNSPEHKKNINQLQGQARRKHRDASTYLDDLLNRNGELILVSVVLKLSDSYYHEAGQPYISQYYNPNTPQSYKISPSYPLTRQVYSLVPVKPTEFLWRVDHSPEGIANAVLLSAEPSDAPKKKAASAALARELIRLQLPPRYPIYNYTNVAPIITLRVGQVNRMRKLKRYFTRLLNFGRSNQVFSSCKGHIAKVVLEYMAPIQIRAFFFFDASKVYDIETHIRQLQHYWEDNLTQGQCVMVPSVIGQHDILNCHYKKITRRMKKFLNSFKEHSIKVMTHSELYLKMIEVDNPFATDKEAGKDTYFLRGEFGIERVALRKKIKKTRLTKEILADPISPLNDSPKPDESGYQIAPVVMMEPIDISPEEELEHLNINSLAPLETDKNHPMWDPLTFSPTLPEGMTAEEALKIRDIGSTFSEAMERASSDIPDPDVNWPSIPVQLSSSDKRKNITIIKKVHRKTLIGDSSTTDQRQKSSDDPETKKE